MLSHYYSTEDTTMENTNNILPIMLTFKYLEKSPYGNVVELGIEKSIQEHAEVPEEFIITDDDMLYDIVHDTYKTCTETEEGQRAEHVLLPLWLDIEKLTIPDILEIYQEDRPIDPDIIKIRIDKGYKIKVNHSHIFDALSRLLI